MPDNGPALGSGGMGEAIPALEDLKVMHLSLLNVYGSRPQETPPPPHDPQC